MTQTFIRAHTHSFSLTLSCTQHNLKTHTHTHTPSTRQNTKLSQARSSLRFFTSANKMCSVNVAVNCTLWRNGARSALLPLLFYHFRTHPISNHFDMPSGKEKKKLRKKLWFMRFQIFLHHLTHRRISHIPVEISLIAKYFQQNKNETNNTQKKKKKIQK